MPTITEQLKVADAAQIVATSESGKYEFTRVDLEAAFNMVAPRPNWKEKIDTVVHLSGDPEKQIAALHEAIKFFCGCSAAIDYTYYSTITKPTVSVVAAGYYSAVGP